MTTPPSIRIALALALPGVLLLADPAMATPPAPAPSEAPLSALVLGRKNPFRPLVHLSRPGAALPDLPAQPGPALPKTASAPRIARTVPAVAYVGLAYDGAEAIAAVRHRGKVRFVRRGERVAGITLVTITPTKLVWSKGGRRIETALRSRPGETSP